MWCRLLWLHRFHHLHLPILLNHLLIAAIELYLYVHLHLLLLNFLNILLLLLHLLYHLPMLDLLLLQKL